MKEIYKRRKEKDRLQKKVRLVFLAAIIPMIVVCIVAACAHSMSVKAASTSSKGVITPGVTNVRIRTSTDTSSTSNVITKVDGGFQMDILDTVNTSDTSSWYYIGFYLDGTYTYGYVYGEYVTIVSSDEDPGYSSDSDFEAYLTEQGFPESYKADLRTLHEQYPNWIFIADQTGKDWSEVVSNENVLGRSLIYSSAISSWKSTADGAYDWSTGTWTSYDTGGWVQASSELVQYALDPRNFLNSTNVFMFESLSYNNATQSQSGVSNIIAGTFMANSSHDLSYNGTSYSYASGLMLAGSISGVSPYHLATRIIQEQGSQGTGGSITGTVSGYEGYYNYYNQGAYASGGLTAIQRGMVYAAATDSSTLRPWNTRMKSIIGGAMYIGSKYINRGQNTIYYEKFDLVTPYTHQYMTNVLAARSESSTASKAYSDSTKQSTALIFRIPVYDNMPSSACEIPTGDGSPNNKLSDLSIDGYSMSPTFNMFTESYDLIVSNSVTGINVSASLADSSSSVSGTGWHNLSVGTNLITVKVTAQNGDSTTYTLNVVRKEAENSGSSGGNSGSSDSNSGGSSSGDTSGFTTDYTVNSDAGLLSGIGLGSSTDSVLNGINCTGGAYTKMYDTDGNEYNGTVGTGNHIVIYDSNGNVIKDYTVVIYGDLNGDGNVDIYDLIYMRRDLLDIQKLTGAYQEAADTNRGSDGIDIYDLIYLRRHLLGIEYIRQ